MKSRLIIVTVDDADSASLVVHCFESEGTTLDDIYSGDFRTLCTLSCSLCIVGIIRNKPCRVFRETLVFCLDMKGGLTAL